MACQQRGDSTVTAIVLSLQSQGEINALQRCDRGAYPNQVKITDEVSLPK